MFIIAYGFKQVSCSALARPIVICLHMYSGEGYFPIAEEVLSTSINPALHIGLTQKTSCSSEILVPFVLKILDVAILEPQRIHITSATLILTS